MLSNWNADFKIEQFVFYEDQVISTLFQYYIVNTGIDAWNITLYLIIAYWRKALIESFTIINIRIHINVKSTKRYFKIQKYT